MGAVPGCGAQEVDVAEALAPGTDSTSGHTGKSVTFVQANETVSSSGQRPEDLESPIRDIRAAQVEVIAAATQPREAIHAGVGHAPVNPPRPERAPRPRGSMCEDVPDHRIGHLARGAEPGKIAFLEAGGTTATPVARTPTPATHRPAASAAKSPMGFAVMSERPDPPRSYRISHERVPAIESVFA